MPAPLPRPVRSRPRSLAELAACLCLPAPARAAALTGVTHASDAARPGDLFVAWPGARVHGATHARAAVEAGAVAVLTDPAGHAALGDLDVPVLVVPEVRPVVGRVAAFVYGDPTAGMTVLGLTGTNGKTTTTHLLEAGLRAAGHTTGLIGTVETRIAGQAVPSAHTTPEATDLQAIFAVMAERGVTAAAMEVSSHALTYGRADAIRFTVGGFTNLSRDHLDFHTDMEDYFAAKSRLFDGRCEHEIVNVDDPYGRRLVRSGTVTVSAAGDPTATWRAADAEPVPAGGTGFRALGPDGRSVPARVAMPGAFNVANALLAIATLDLVGIDPEPAARAIAELGVPGRMERVDAGQDFTAVVDFAHTPDAVATALATLRPTCAGKLIVVLGCGGDRDRDKRPLMGAAAARGADLVVVTDDNPRSEDPAAIRAAMARGADEARAGEWTEVGDRKAAIEEAVRRARPGDTVLVAGKGHESGQEVAGTVYPFDDRAVLRAAIESVSA